MLECFILCRRNDAQAEEMYLNKYPEKRQPGRAMFRRLKDNLIAYGSFAKVKRNKPVDENKENLVLQNVVETPRTSLRHIEELTGVNIILIVNGLARGSRMAIRLEEWHFANHSEK